MQVAELGYQPSSAPASAPAAPAPRLIHTRIEQLQTFRADSVRELTHCPDPVRVVSKELGRMLLLACKRRTCEHCYHRYWLPRVRARMMSGLRGKGKAGDIVLVTVTGPGAHTLSTDEEIRAWNRGSSTRLRLVLAAIRHRFPGCTYFRVGEYQRRGVLHYHICVRGLRFIPHGWLTEVCTAHGFGYCWVSPQPARDNGAVAKYLTKYLTKNAMPTHAKGSKVYTMGRDWCLNWQPAWESGFRRKWVYASSDLNGFTLLFPPADSLKLSRGPP